MNKRGLKKDGTPDNRGAKKKHGLIHHPIYIIWGSMIRRCYKPKDRAYKWYGAKGVTICDEWLNDFKAFYDWAIENGWQKGWSIERENNNEGYNPQNCSWIKRGEQSQNRGSNYKITHLGETKTLAQWSRDLGFKYMLVRYRLTRGWDFLRAISEPGKIYSSYNLPIKRKRLNNL